MSVPTAADQNWTEELVRFLRDQPEVRAVRVDPVARKVSVATINPVHLADLEAKLAATIVAVEAKLAAKAAAKPAQATPGGYSLKQEGG
ncbi:MAG: hypothetical protein WCR49_15620, partial [Opitutae bacterium]